MPHLRQLVIAAEDPERLAKFYQEVFDLEKIDEEPGCVFLSDGTFNLSVATASRTRRNGISLPGLRHCARRVGPQETRPCGAWRSSDVYEVQFAGGHRSRAAGSRRQYHRCLNRRAFDAAYVSTAGADSPYRSVHAESRRAWRSSTVTVLDMKEVERTDRSSIFVSDGYFNWRCCTRAKKNPWGSIISAFTSKQ